MVRITGIIVSLMMFQVGIGTAAPLVGDTMVEPVSGMEFVWVPQGCFQPGVNSDAPAVASIQVTNKAADSGRVHFDGVDGEQIHEVSLLDDDGLEDATLDDATSNTSDEALVFNDPTALNDQPVDSENLTCLSHGFWMGKYEVTQGQYRGIVGENPSGFKKGDQYPVERVRWLDARKFIRHLNKLSGKHFSLPSEAQWEYAARSGGKSRTYGASGNAASVAWYMGNSRNSSHPVGEKKPNTLGLYDMSGNVWEWTADCWNETLSSMPKDGSANKSGNCAARVLRGGSWYDAKALITTTSRLWNDTDRFDNNSGFRLVLD